MTFFTRKMIGKFFCWILSICLSLCVLFTYSQKPNIQNFPNLDWYMEFEKVNNTLIIFSIHRLYQNLEKTQFISKHFCLKYHVVRFSRRMNIISIDLSLLVRQENLIKNLVQSSQAYSWLYFHECYFIDVVI